MLGWKILGVAVAVIIVAAVAAGSLMYFRLVPIPGPLLALLAGAREPEYSARFYPPDTMAYGWITLVPGEGQIADMQDIWGRLNEYPGFEDFVEEAKIDFRDETGIDFDEEVLPWVGPEISGGVIDYDPGAETIRAAVTVGVRDKDAAKNFLDKWIQYMEDQTNADFETHSHAGVTIFEDESAYQAYSVSGYWLVYATDTTTLISILDRINGDNENSLASTEIFAQARAALPEKRFHSGYVNYHAALDSIGEEDQFFAPAIPGVIGPAAFAEHAPEWVAISGSWVERGLVVEMVSPTVSDLGLNVPDLADLAAILPKDTFGFMAASFDPDVDNWRKVLSEYYLRDVLPDAAMIEEINESLEGMTPDGGPALSADATLSDALDLGFSLAKQFTGIDLEKDFFGHLDGNLIVGVRDFDFRGVAADPTGNPVDVTVMLSYNQGGGEPLADTMADVADLLTNFVGLMPEGIDVGAENDAEVFDLNQFSDLAGGRIGYRPGYVLHDGYLTIGSTEDALTTTVELQNGGGDGLVSDDEFNRALSHLPPARQFLGYIAVSRIVDQVGAEGFGNNADRFQVIDETLGVVAFSSEIETDYSRTATVLTLFPQ